MVGVNAKGLQRYLCKSCGHTFSGIDGFTGRHFKPEVIVRALSMMMAVKMSPYEVCGQLKMENIICHYITIARWADHYSDIMCKYSSTLRVDAGYQWHVDELFFKIRGIYLL